MSVSLLLGLFVLLPVIGTVVCGVFAGLYLLIRGAGRAYRAIVNDYDREGEDL